MLPVWEKHRSQWGVVTTCEWKERQDHLLPVGLQKWKSFSGGWHQWQRQTTELLHRHPTLHHKVCSWDPELPEAHHKSRLTQTQLTKCVNRGSEVRAMRYKDRSNVPLTWPWVSEHCRRTGWGHSSLPGKGCKPAGTAAQRETIVSCVQQQLPADACSLQTSGTFKTSCAWTYLNSHVRVKLGGCVPKCLNPKKNKTTWNICS